MCKCEVSVYEFEAEPLTNFKLPPAYLKQAWHKHTLEFSRSWWLNLVNSRVESCVCKFGIQITLLTKLKAGKLAHNKENIVLWSCKVYYQDTTQCHDFEYIWRVPILLFGFIMINCGRDEKLSFCKDSSQSKFDIRSLVLTWEVAEDNPEHIDFWRISINKVKTHVYVLHKAMNIFRTWVCGGWGGGGLNLMS